VGVGVGSDKQFANPKFILIDFCLHKDLRTKTIKKTTAINYSIYENQSKYNQPIFPTTKQFQLSNCFLIVLPSKII
jgi:hypothetical protein